MLLFRRGAWHSRGPRKTRWEKHTLACYPLQPCTREASFPECCQVLHVCAPSPDPAGQPRPSRCSEKLRCALARQGGTLVRAKNKKTAQGNEGGEYGTGGKRADVTWNAIRAPVTNQLTRMVSAVCQSLIKFIESSSSPADEKIYTTELSLWTM